MQLRKFHEALGARFTTVNGIEAVADYGDRLGEHAAMRGNAGLLDLTFRGRLCLTGADRVRFLHGQVTNDIKRLSVGSGCYAALVTAKGRMESDLNIYSLADELLLDFEPGLTQKVSQRLAKYIVADDVEVVDIGPLYGLLSVQGPAAESFVRGLGLFPALPSRPFQIVKCAENALGELYLANRPRLGTVGFDLFAPVERLPEVAQKLVDAARATGVRACGWDAFETARIEAGVPRFGIDMDESNFPQECGIEADAVSYSKGCYIGQEVLNRIHTQGHVNRILCGLRLADGLQVLPTRGTRLFSGDRDIGWITSAVASPALRANIGLGYVHREVSQPGTQLTLKNPSDQTFAMVVPLPFREPSDRELRALEV
jgi:folate-binding protein YgfZ